MEAWVNMAHLLAQPQQKLQLNYKTTITQNHQKIELYGSLTTKELKKSHSSRGLGGPETRRRGDEGGGAHTHVWWIKNLEGYLGNEGFPAPPQITQRGFQCQEDNCP